MRTVMKFCDVVVSQIKAGNRKALCLLLLKLVFIYIIFSELYDDFRYLACLIGTGNRMWPFCIIGRIFLIKLLVLLYYGIRRLKKKFSPGYAVTGLIIFCLMTSWINGSLFGFFFWDGPYWGRITDADTGEPVAGASVVGKWRFEGYQLYIGLAYRYADSRETVTDRNGFFFLPPARSILFWPFARIALEDIIVFKSGYDSHPPRMCRAWSDEEDRKWHSRLKPQIRKRYESVPDSDYAEKYRWEHVLEDSSGERYYRVLFEIPGKRFRIYKPSTVRLNRAKSPEEQREAAAVSLSEVPFCESKIKIPIIKEVVNK